MLVLTRRDGDQHGQTKIGIDAPKCINIVRDEIDES